MEWPHDNERLFQLESDWQNNACLMRTSLAELGEHYRDAADLLIKEAINRDVLVDHIVHPAVYLYRHYLELTLKDIIWRTRRLENQGYGHPMTHKLSDLWAETKGLLRRHYGADTPQELDYLDQCIQELQEHDPDSMAFRYPCDKTGDQHLQNLSHINVRHLMETMQRTANLLSCITIDISERLQWKVEMEQDARS